MLDPPYYVVGKLYIFKTVSDIVFITILHLNMCTLYFTGNTFSCERVGPTSPVTNP